MNQKATLLIALISSLSVMSTTMASTSQYAQRHQFMQKQTLLKNHANDDKIDESDKYKDIANEYLNNNDYHNAKLYFHKAIDALKDEQEQCIDMDRVFALKMSCQAAQDKINYEHWGFKQSDDKHQYHDEIAVLVEQLHHLKVSGYENISTEELEAMIDNEKHHVMMDFDSYLSMWDHVFNDDGIDYAILDHMGLYHVTVFIPIELLADAAHILNVNIALISNDTNAPMIIKQKNAIATLYIGYSLNFDDPENQGYVFTNSAYRDDQSTPKHSIDELVANAPYSYEE